MNQQERLNYLIAYLINENKEYQNLMIPEDEKEKKRLLRSLMNVRMPMPISEQFLQVQDAYLKEESMRKGIVKISDLKPIQKGIYLWQGDITALVADAIVNAANNQLLGCFVPCHGCIDNAIHSASGIQLRLECAKIMESKTSEPTGQAQMTQAYNLPSKYVIHTVGPIIVQKVTQKDCELLASCYRSCLEKAAEAHCRSIAFCCISTGEFHFPNQLAAEIAVQTVKEFLDEKHELEVIFNVFKDKDYQIYRRLLQ